MLVSSRTLGFSISPASTANEIILTRTAALAPSGQSLPFHRRYQSILAWLLLRPSADLATDDASGPASDYGGIAFNITDDQPGGLTTVPPYLIFCTGTTIGGLNCANANGDFIDFGELSSQPASSGSSQLLVATNAEFGYNVTISGTTMTSGNNMPLRSGDR